MTTSFRCVLGVGLSLAIACAERDSAVRVRVEPLGLRAGIAYDVYLWAQEEADAFRFDRVAEHVGLAPRPDGSLDLSLDCGWDVSASPVRLLEVVARRADVDPARKDAIQSDVPEIIAGRARGGAERFAAPSASALLARDTRAFLCEPGSADIPLRLGVVDAPVGADGSPSLSFELEGHRFAAFARAEERGDAMEVRLDVVSRAGAPLPELYLVAEPTSGVPRTVEWQAKESAATLHVSLDLTQSGVPVHAGGMDDHEVIMYRGDIFLFDGTAASELVTAPVVPYVGAVRTHFIPGGPAVAGLDVVRVVATGRYAPDRFGGTTVGRFSNCEAAEIPGVGKGPGVEVYLGTGLDPAGHSEYASDYYWAFARRQGNAFVPIQAIGAHRRAQPGEFFVLIRDWRDPGRVFAGACGFLRDVGNRPARQRIRRGPGSDLPSPCDELARGSRQLQERTVAEMLELLARE